MNLYPTRLFAYYLKIKNVKGPLGKRYGIMGLHNASSKALEHYGPLCRFLKALLR